MSIQDESFPDDILEMSCNSGKSFVFPHHKPRRSTSTKDDDTNGADVRNVNQDLTSSSLQDDKDDSTQSSNGCCVASETSGKTNLSEPTDLQEPEKKKSEFTRSTTSKSISYQDIHSEYTKKRYKHVESKVGQYIANMKAQDKKRNSGKFQRHRSMPETLHGTESSSIPELLNDSKKCGILRRSADDVDQIQSDNENYDDNLTATTSTSSTRELGPDAGIYLNKQIYEQLLSSKDYLKTKLEEKNAENWRLKQNLDTMRIEYSMCKDKLKQQTQTQRFSGSFGSISAAATLGRNSLQSLLYPVDTKDTSTQTERFLTPSPVAPLLNGTEMFPTPSTPDSNNNSQDFAAVGRLAPGPQKVLKTIATIQPLSLNFSNVVDQDSHINNTIGLLRHRSNSLVNRKKSTPLPMNVSKVSSASSGGPCSSDSAIDIEVIESPKSQRQSRREEFIYYDQRSQRYAVLETRNASQSYADINGSNSSQDITVAEAKNLNGKRNCRKRQNLRSRMMRLFGACTKCDDPNMSLDSNANSQQQSLSQIPLLEKSSQNYCRNVR